MSFQLLAVKQQVFYQALIYTWLIIEKPSFYSMQKFLLYSFAFTTDNIGCNFFFLHGSCLKNRLNTRKARGSVRHATLYSAAKKYIIRLATNKRPAVSSPHLNPLLCIQQLH